MGEVLRDWIYKSSDEELGQVLIQLKTILGYASPHRRGLDGGIGLPPSTSAKLH